MSDDWQPPPGMTRLRCDDCRKLFAAPSQSIERTCPTCRVPSMRRATTRRVGKPKQSRPVFDATAAGRRLNPWVPA